MPSPQRQSSIWLPQRCSRSPRSSSPRVISSIRNIQRKANAVRRIAPMENSLTNLSGIIPPMITPLADRDALDHPGLDRLIEHQIHGGVHGLFILGTCGESAALSSAVRRDLITRCSDQIAARIPLLVGVTDTSLTESIHLASHA